MGMVKQDSQLIPQQRAYRVGNTHPVWEMHPDWIQALRNLDTYNQWVCEILMPIVFQWIEEHKDEVYRNISRESDQYDDMGVIIERAFQIVREQKSYKDGVQKSDDYHRELEKKTLSTGKLNPVWQAMSNALDKARTEVRSRFKEVLPNSIRPDAS